MWILQVTTLFDKDFSNISDTILSHFKPLFYYKLKKEQAPICLGQLYS